MQLHLLLVIITLGWCYSVPQESSYTLEDKFTPSSCDKIAKAGDHILLTYESFFSNGTSGPGHPKYTQPLHVVLDPKDELPLHQAIKGMCQNSTRSLQWASISKLRGVALSPIVGFSKDLVLDSEEALEMDVHIEYITEPFDYQIFDAFKHENLSKVLDYIDEHVGINAMDEYGQTPLMIAVSKQYDAVVASLLNARRPKVDVNMAKTSGFTAIFYAVEKASPTILQALLRRGADPTAQVQQAGSRGNTPLHFACMLEKTKHIELLLEYGGNPVAKNEHGLTPLQLLPRDAVSSVKFHLKSLFEKAYQRQQSQQSGNRLESSASVPKSGSPRTDM